MWWMRIIADTLQDVSHQSQLPLLIIYGHMFSYRRRGGVRHRGRTNRSVFPLTLFALQLCFLCTPLSSHQSVAIVVTTIISPYTRSCNSIVPVVLSFTPIQPKQYYPWNDGRGVLGMLFWLTRLWYNLFPDKAVHGTKQREAADIVWQHGRLGTQVYLLSTRYCDCVIRETSCQE